MNLLLDNKKHYIFRAVVSLIIVIFFNFVFVANSATPSVAVIYPELRAPYNKIFTDIADGVEKTVNGKTRRYSLPKDYSPDKLNKWIAENSIEVCVALGVRGESASINISNRIPVLLSGVLTPKSMNHSRSTLSLAASPKMLFDKVTELSPNVKKIVVVYNPSKFEWLINNARQAAELTNLELVKYSTTSLVESARIYRKIFSRSDLDEIAIWLPPDPTSVDKKTLLSFILQESWSHNTPVFSSNPAHVNKGVLFAMYPDNTLLGERLGRYALNELNGGTGRLQGVVPVKDLRIAINRRTAEHIGISISSADLRTYDAVFPSE